MLHPILMVLRPALEPKKLKNSENNDKTKPFSKIGRTLVNHMTGLLLLQSRAVRCDRCHESAPRLIFYRVFRPRPRCDRPAVRCDFLNNALALLHVLKMGGRFAPAPLQ